MEENGLLSLTQRLAATHCGEKDAADHTRDVTNPFGPTKFQSSYQTGEYYVSGIVLRWLNIVFFYRRCIFIL